MKLSRMLHQRKTPLPRTFVTIWIAVMAALVVSGAYFMFERLASGLDVANATNLIPWGLWVSVYIWFAGLAGGLYLVSALTYLLRIDRFAPIARLALGGSIVSLVVSMIFIGIDLGALRHSPNTLLFFHWSSPLAWEIKAYIFFMIVAVAQLVLVIRSDHIDARKQGNANLIIRVLAGVGVATSFVGPPGGTGMFFAAVKARGLWEGGITSVLFYVMAVVCAAAFLLVVYSALCKLRGRVAQKKTQRGLATVFAVALFAQAFVVFFQFAPMMLSSDARSLAAADVLLSGWLAPVFWAGEIGLGFVVPIVLIVFGIAQKRVGFWIAAAVSAMAGVLALRYGFVVAGFSAPILEGYPVAQYAPSLNEWMVCAFILGIGLALFSIALRYLPLEKQGASEGYPDGVPIESSATTDCTDGKEARDGAAV